MRLFPAMAALLLMACTGSGKSDTDTVDTEGPVDADGDGFDTSTDCDDDDAVIHPDATEVCDEIDNDCDGEVDEGVSGTFYADEDGDGYGDLADTTIGCEAPSGYVADSTDCDDADDTQHPGADEVCSGEDDDCDGEIDEDEAVDVLTWYADSDGDSYGDASVSDIDCDQPSGYVADSTDCDDADDTQHPGADEYCTGEDDDCDGDVDEDEAVDVLTWYADSDGDSYGDASVSDIDCDQPSGYVADSTDCDDADDTQHPGADEYCTGEDDDCDGDVDEDEAVDVLTWYADSDGDSYGDASVSDIDCDQPSGYVADSTDCDDADDTQHPGADEYCTGEDDDCDGDVDEDEAVDVLTWYADSDGDSYGDASVSDIDCDQPSGYVADSTDCDDADDTQHPGADEYCTGEDDDCDGDVDEDEAVDVLTWYADSDGDSYGDASVSDIDCDQPSGYVADDTDCDDADALTNPGASELCDGVDNDCDSDLTDETGAVSWEDAAGTWTDLTSDYAAGTAASPYDATLADAGTLTFCEGTFYAHLSLEADVDVVGRDGSDTTVLSGGDADSVVRVETDGLAISLTGLTLTGGLGTSVADGASAAGGGGLFCNAESALTIEDLVFTDNVADEGAGAMVSGDCELDLTDSAFVNGEATSGGGLSLMTGVVRGTDVDFTDNVVTSMGGGVCVDSGELDLTGGTFSGNQQTGSDFGGGVALIGATATFDDVTFSSNSSAEHGGAIAATAVTVLTVEATTFEDNSAKQGGAVYLSESDSATFSDVTFSGNATTNSGNGGGMRLDQSDSLSLSEVSFEDNTGQLGAGLYLYDSVSASISEVDFTDNAAGAYGGGLCQLYAENTSLSEVTFTGNTATYYGGGMYVSISEATSLSEVSFEDNSTSKEGGGLWLYYSDSSTLTDVTFTENSATSEGGGAHLHQSQSVTFTDVIFSGNDAEDGGGLHFYNADDADLASVTFEDNTAEYGAGLYLASTTDAVLGTVSFTDNVASVYGGGIYLDWYSSLTGTTVSFSGSSPYDVNFNSDPFSFPTTGSITCTLYSGDCN